MTAGTRVDVQSTDDPTTAALRIHGEITSGSEGVLTDAEWLAVLTEEVGEAARAIQDEDDESLRTELVQVAAMACRWAVSIPHGRVRPPWAGRGA